jgi:TRAP-type C4-dicarboxylate transport system substrate-binding protein
LILAAVCPVSATRHAAADEPPLPRLHLKVIGGLADARQFVQHEEPFWTRQIAERSGGRITAEVSAFDAVGLRGPEVLQLMRLGVIAFGTLSLNVIASEDPEAAGVDLVGMNPDIASLRRSVEAYRETLATLYRERYGIEILAVWTYPAQILFCTPPIAGLRDIAGLRVRVAGVTHADFVGALGGIGVTLPFAGTRDALRNKVVDCAVTAAMSGYRLGLQHTATHILDMPLSWGPNVLAVNRASWQNLDPAAQEFLKRELTTLEAAIWGSAELESREGIACLTGNGGRCTAGEPGRLRLLPTRDENAALLRKALVGTVLPRWAERCGADCVEGWNGTVGRSVGIVAMSIE